MAYTKIGWVNGRTPAINQTNLNHMDQGIFDAHSKLSEYEDIFTGDVAESVQNWLDEHPEATTTVEDASLTYKKLVLGTLGFVIPEMFGAVGDGVTDDSTAIQNAIASGYKVLFPKKSYFIGTTINVGEGNCLIGNYATLCGDADPIIKIQTYTPPTQNHNSKPVIFEKFRIEGNESNTLVLVQNATKVKVADLDLSKFLNGIVFDGGYENLFSCCRFIGTASTPNTIGFYEKSGGDSYIEHLTGRDIAVAVKVSSGHNVYDDIHFWLYYSSMYEGSIMIYDDAPGGGTNVFKEVYFDTYQKCYYKTGLANAVFDHPRALNHPSIASTDDCVLFFIDNADFVSTYNDRVRFNGVITSLSNTTRCIHACNNTTMPLYLTFEPTNSVQTERFRECNLVNDLNIRRLVRGESISLNAGFSITSGFLYKKDRHIYGDLTIVSNSPMGTSEIDIGSLLYKPDVTINSYCCTGTSEWNSQHLAYLYYSTNSIVVKPYVSGDTSIKIHFDYVMTA